MFNSQLLCAANQPAGACGWCPRSAQLYTRSSPALRFQYGSRPSISASPCQAAERQHASAASSTGLEISRKHDLSESTSCREGPHKNRSQEIWGIEQLKQRHIHEQGHGWKAAQASLWHWEWGSTRWRASFFFLMASVAFVIGSAALLQPHIFAGACLTMQALIFPSGISPSDELQRSTTQAGSMPMQPNLIRDIVCVQAADSWQAFSWSGHLLLGPCPT